MVEQCFWYFVRFCELFHSFVYLFPNRDFMQFKYFTHSSASVEILQSRMYNKCLFFHPEYCQPKERPNIWKYSNKNVLLLLSDYYSSVQMNHRQNNEIMFVPCGSRFRLAEPPNDVELRSKNRPSNQLYWNRIQQCFVMPCSHCIYSVSKKETYQNGNEVDTNNGKRSGKRLKYRSKNQEL